MEFNPACKLSSLAVLTVLLLQLCAGCNQNTDQSASSSAPAASSQTATGEQTAAPALELDDRSTSILGYPGLEFGTPLSGLDYTEMQHGSYARGLYAYQRDELVEFTGGKIPATLMLTAFATEPGVGHVEGVILTYDVKGIEWDNPEEPGLPAEFILSLRTKLLTEYSPDLIVENTDTADHAYLSLIDADGNSVWLSFQQGSATRNHSLSLGYRSSALRNYRDQLEDQP